MELRDVDLSIARDVVDGPPTRALVRDGRWLLGQALLPRSDEPAGATWAQVVAPQLYARRRLGAEAPPGSPYGPADVTAVVCTRDRPDLLAGCLDALTGLDPAPAAVLVVDSASTTSTTRDLAEARGATVVRADLPGLDRARNLGLAGCRTPLVAFVDDDARVDVHWARAAAEAFFDPRIALVTGLIIPAEVETTAQEWFERNGGMAKGFAPALYAAADVGFATHRLGAGACTAFRRDVLVGLGGFDPHLDVGTPTGGGGDLEMFWRVLAAGHTAFYWPQMAVRHVHRRELPG